MVMHNVWTPVNPEPASRLSVRHWKKCRLQAIPSVSPFHIGLPAFLSESPCILSVTFDRLTIGSCFSKPIFLKILGWRRPFFNAFYHGHPKEWCHGWTRKKNCRLDLKTQNNFAKTYFNNNSQQRVKNPGPKDQALLCPCKGLDCRNRKSLKWLKCAKVPKVMESLRSTDFYKLAESHNFRAHFKL